MLELLVGLAITQINTLDITVKPCDIISTQKIPYIKTTLKNVPCEHCHPLDEDCQRNCT